MIQRDFLCEQGPFRNHKKQAGDEDKPNPSTLNINFEFFV